MHAHFIEKHYVVWSGGKTYKPKRSIILYEVVVLQADGKHTQAEPVVNSPR